MKKPWLLFIAGGILTLLLGLWLYLFFGGDQAKEDLYSTFGFSGDELPFDLGNIFEDEPATSTPAYLRQLSLRDAAGFMPQEGSDTDSRVVFLAEKGTGHIYKVRVSDGTEQRVSNITVAGTRLASFSSDGAYAVLYTENTPTFTLVSLPNASTSLTSTTLNGAPISVHFTEDSLLYAVRDGQSVKAYVYKLTTGATEPLFTVPFREAVVLWGETESGPHYTFPKPADELEGYLYKIERQTMTRLPVSGFGLTAKKDGEKIIYSITVPGGRQTSLYQSDSIATLNATALPEKCVSRGDAVICAAPESAPVSLASWYQGEQDNTDSLWYFLPDIQYKESIENISLTANRTLDVIEPEITERAFYFINKIDGGLWVYDRDLLTSIIDN